MTSLTEAELEELGSLTESIWNYVLDQVGDRTTVSKSELAKAALALGAAAKRMEKVALDESLPIVETTKD